MLYLDRRAYTSGGIPVFRERTPEVSENQGMLDFAAAIESRTSLREDSAGTAARP